MARKMKDSGIEWIGEIPEGWTKNKVIRLFDTIGSGTTPKNITSDFPVVNWIQSGDITGSFMSACKNVISANLLSQYSALKVYPSPFIIVAMYGASVGNASISLIDGCVNQACCVLSSPSCNFHYAFYVIKSAQSYLVRKAVGGGQPNISQETIKQLWLPLPPLSIQDIIVRNLDATCSKIDDLLTSVHASIEEYKKLKQAVITQAVTEGTPAMFSSPHSVKLKYLISIVSGEAIRNEQLSDFGEYPVYGGGEIIGFCSQYNTSEGSLIIGRVGARCGCVTHTTCKSWATDNALIVLPTCNAKYMYYVIGYCQLNNLNTSNAQPLITSTKIKNVVVPYFSDAMQQQEIADYLDAKCAEIDKLIAKKEQLVKELESYKKSLIYEVVTGKREV